MCRLNILCIYIILHITIKFHEDRPNNNCFPKVKRSPEEWILSYSAMNTAR